jgi:hypothetical protein
MSIGDLSFHFSPSGLPDLKDLDDATTLRLGEWKIERGFTIPYCAGWDERERIVYVDQAVPETWEVQGRVLQIVEGALFWHESLESDICREYPPEHYAGGHTVATYFENAYVTAHGFDANRYENEFWAPLIKAIGSRKSYPRVPKGMSLLPYTDSKDQTTIAKMKFV